MTTDDVFFSRPLASAAALADVAEDRHRFIDKKVLIAGETKVLSTPNGRMCLLASMHLAIRICRNVSMALPEGNQDLRKECEQKVAPLAFGHPIEFVGLPTDFDKYDAILSVGSVAQPEFPWTVVNSNGFLARVSSEATDLPEDCSQTNPIGALAAASLGVAETFKRLLKLKASRGRLLDALSFSLITYQPGESDAGPQLPGQIDIDPLLVGAGAIGSSVVYLLSHLPIAGYVSIVDPQRFEPGNLGTSILLGPEDIGKGKASLAAEKLRQNSISAQGFEEDLSEFEKRLGTEIAYPKLVLGALDNIEARHAVQDLWPDTIIDGAIGDFGCQVSRHPWGENVACLRCLFHQPTGKPAEQAASRMTGLTPERVQRASECINQEDIGFAPPARKDWLRKRIGQKICSVVQEAFTEELSEERQREDFAPSVPFVASLSACMMVGEMIKFAASWPTPLRPRFQFDVLRGPALGELFDQERHSNCLCVARQHNIETIRQLRSKTKRE